MRTPFRNPEKQATPSDDKPVKTHKRHWDVVPLSFFADCIDAFPPPGGKYKQESWKHCAPEDVNAKYYSAMMRHIMAYRDGEIIDPQSGKPHMAHVMANAGIINHHTRKPQ